MSRMGKGASTFRTGDHVCALYSTKTELAGVAAGFLAAGIGRGERCWYVPAGAEGPAIRGALKKRGVDVDGCMRRGALSVLPDDDTYAVHGGFDPERTIQVFSDAIEQALNDGFTGFRAAADMSWALALKGGSTIVVAYEALLRQLFATCKVTGLCLYDRRRMPLNVLNGALVMHPIAGSGDAFQQNPFYEHHAVALPKEDDAAVLAKLQTLDRAAAARKRSSHHARVGKR